MNKTLYLIFALILLISCQEVERTPKPDDLIPKDKMAEILTEVSLLQGARSLNKNMMENKGIDPYPYLMEKFQIDSAQLVNSNNYYAENAGEYQEIYEKVKLNLEGLLEKYDSIRALDEIKRDTIQKFKQNRDSLIGFNSRDSLFEESREVDSLIPDTNKYDFATPISRVRSQPKDTVNR